MEDWGWRNGQIEENGRIGQWRDGKGAGESIRSFAPLTPHSSPIGKQNDYGHRVVDSEAPLLNQTTVNRMTAWRTAQEQVPNSWTFKCVWKTAMLLRSYRYCILKRPGDGPG